MLNRFNRLLGELLRGSMSRNTFQPWEVELLIDLETCQIPEKRRAEVLRQYQRAVGKQLETTPGPPMTLSRYLEIVKSLRAAKALAGQNHPPAQDAIPPAQHDSNRL
jgi:hypothetical protein